MRPPDWKSQIHPDLRSTYRRAPNFTLNPWTSWLTRHLLSLVPVPRADGLTLRQVDLDTHRIHLFAPEGGPTRPGALLWMHGGGRVIGSPLQSGATCIRIARSLGIVVAATGYRLAPRHPYPAALDDCAASWRWLQDHAAELGIDPARVVIGGESAGGGLTAELCQRLRDEGGTQPAGQLLIYPMLDDRTATRADLTALRHPVWNNTSNRYAWSCYLGAPPGSPAVGAYAVAARCVDLSGLPPAWLTVGTLDLFYEENRAYIERLKDSGVPAELYEIEGGFHGCLNLGRAEPPIVALWQRIDAFLRSALDPTE